MLFVFSGFAIFVVFVTRKEVSNNWFLFCWRIWPFLLLTGRTCRTWTILWTERLLSNSGHGMATPAPMEVDNNNNVVDIINCVALYYEKDASGNVFLRKGKFRVPASRLSLKRNSRVSRPEFKSSRELKRSLNFNDLNIRVLYLEYQWTLCPALRSSKGSHFRWRSKLPAWKGVRICSCYSIQ